MNQSNAVDSHMPDHRVHPHAPHRTRGSGSHLQHRGQDGCQVGPHDGRHGDRAATAGLLQSIRGMGPQQDKNRPAVLDPTAIKGAQALQSGGSQVGNIARGIGQVANTVASIDGSLKDKLIKAIKPSAEVGTPKPVEPGKIQDTFGKLKDKLSFGGKIAGPLGIATGGVGLAQAVSQIRHGKTVPGVFNLASSGATLGSGATGTAAAFKLGGTAEKVASLGKTAGVLGGVAVVAEGGLDIYSGVKGHNDAKIAQGGLKTAAGGLLIAGAATGNPVLALGGGLLYGGTEIWQNRKAIGHFVSQGFHTAEHAVSSVINDLNPFS